MGKITISIVSKAHNPLDRFLLQPFNFFKKKKKKQKQNHIKLEPGNSLLKMSLAAVVSVLSEC